MGLPNLKESLMSRSQELKVLCTSPSLIIEDCSSASDHHSYSRMELPQLEDLRAEHCPSLRDTICMTMPKLAVLIEGDCGELKVMGFTDIVLERSPSSHIEIKNFKTRWLPLLAVDDDEAVGSTSFFRNVGRLHIENCAYLAVLPKALHIIASLWTLDIRYCLQLASIPELPTMLKVLHIQSCTNLQYLPTGLGDLTYLQLIWITDCPQLQARLDDRLPPNLERIYFRNCRQIKKQLKREEWKDWLD